MKLNGTYFGFISADVMSERYRQEERKEAGDFAHTLSDPEMDDFTRLACLMEELGEVAKSVLVEQGLATDDLEDGHLEKEIIQVLALGYAWLELRRALKN